MHLLLYGTRDERVSALIRSVLAELNISCAPLIQGVLPPVGSTVFAEDADAIDLLPLADHPCRVVGTIKEEIPPEALCARPEFRLTDAKSLCEEALRETLVKHLKAPSLSELLGIRKGVTCIVGGGGKTTAMLKLAKELSEKHTCIVGTTTNIFPPALPTLLDPTEEEVGSALRKENLLCVGTPAKMGKLASVSEALLERLPALCDYVILEADGSKHMPLKAPAEHEPVLFEKAGLVIALAGMDGANRPISEVCHRPQLYAALLGTGEEHLIAPEDIAKVLVHENGQKKNVTCDFIVILNKADSAERFRAARQAAAALPCTALITALEREPSVYEIWRNGTCLW